LIVAVTIPIAANFGVIAIRQRTAHGVLVIGALVLGYFLWRSGLLQFPGRKDIEPRWARIVTSTLFLLGVISFAASNFVEILPGERSQYGQATITPLIHLTAHQYDELHMLALSSVLAAMYLDLFFVSISRRSDGPTSS